MKIFWAWQSDLPRDVSRVFVRDALLAAIEKLKETPDIEEPTEEARRNDMHLDSDRQGLSGSPDLARAILDKIDASAVFVGDVTPVGKASERGGKPLMNPNVAIELGYAMARLTDARILMILNAAYGDREGLPFDIKHKAGPIIYHLEEAATKEQIRVEHAKLVASLVVALGAFKERQETKREVEPFKEHQPQIGQAFFFKQGDVLGHLKREGVMFTMPWRSVFYLRVIPTKRLERPLPVHLLLRDAGKYGAFGSRVGVYTLENAYGVGVINPAGNTRNVDSITQHFRNGEIWGINADVIRQGERGDERWLLSMPMERTMIESLNFFWEFLNEVSMVEPPYTVIAGIQGLQGSKLVNNNAVIERAGTLYEGTLQLKRVVQNLELATQDKLLLEFFEMVHDQTGMPRPPKLYGFPPDRV